MNTIPAQLILPMPVLKAELGDRDRALRLKEALVPAPRAKAGDFVALGGYISLRDPDPGRIDHPFIRSASGTLIEPHDLAREDVARIGGALFLAQQDPTLSGALDRGLLCLSDDDPDGEQPGFMALVASQAAVLLRSANAQKLSRLILGNITEGHEPFDRIALVLVQSGISEHEKLMALDAVETLLDPWRMDPLSEPFGAALGLLGMPAKLIFTEIS